MQGLSDAVGDYRDKSGQRKNQGADRETQTGRARFSARTQGQNEEQRCQGRPNTEIEAFFEGARIVAEFFSKK